MPNFSKRGSLIDIIVWVVASFLTVIILGLFIYTFSQIGGAIEDVGQVGSINMTEIHGDTFGQVNQSLASMLNIIAFVILFFSGVSILVHNFLVKAHPVFLISYVFINVGAVIVSAYISNRYIALLGQETIGSSLSQLTAANLIMQYLPYWATILGFLGAGFLLIGILRDDRGGIQ